MADTYVATLTLPNQLLALIREEARVSGNSLSSVMRRRILDSYRREAAELGQALVLAEEEQEAVVVNQ